MQLFGGLTTEAGHPFGKFLLGQLFFIQLWYIKLLNKKSLIVDKNLSDEPGSTYTLPDELEIECQFTP
jgi:hypothetical protein